MYQVDESTRTLYLDVIRIDGGTQPRCQIDEALVAEYAEAYADGAEFPPVVVFLDGVDHWLADGFHRVHGARRAGLDQVRVDLRSGTLRDAVLYSIGANAAHGQRRNDDDKRKAVLTLLEDEEWAGWSNCEIARRCGVSDPFVGKLRSSLQTVRSEPTRTYTDRHGNVNTMNVENIGRTPKWREEMGTVSPRKAAGYGEVSPNAHQPTYSPGPMTPRTSFEFPHDPKIIAAALHERFGDDFAADLITELEALIGRNS